MSLPNRTHTRLTSQSSAALRYLLVPLLAAGLLACGPSAAEIKRARQAQYTCEYNDMLQTLVDVVKEKQPPLGMVDSQRGIVMSEWRWHDKDGRRHKKGAAVVGDGAVQFSVRLGIQKRERGFIIAAAPHVTTHTVGSPSAREITRKNAAWPMWADGKVDQLMVDIYSQLKRCEAPLAK